MVRPIRIALSLGAVLAGACSANSDTVAGPAGPPAQMTAVATAIQTAVVGGPPATLPAVHVTDSAGRPVSGVAVTFSLFSGDGSLSGAQATTNGAGVATVGGWNVGENFGQKVVIARAPGLPDVTFTLNAFAPDSGIRAFLLVDPVGDTLTLPGFPHTVAATDLVVIQGDFKRDSLILSLVFAAPVAGATVGAPNSIQGEIEFDLDDNPGTGSASFSDAFGATSGLGVDCFVDLFHSTSVGVPVTNNNTGVTTEAVAVYAGNSMIIRIPMSALGNDDGNFDLVGIVGVLERPTDIFPNVGSVAVRRGASLVASSRLRAGVQSLPRRSWRSARAP